MIRKTIVVYRTDNHTYMKRTDAGYDWVRDPLDATDVTGVLTLAEANPFYGKGLDGNPIKEGDTFHTELMEFSVETAAYPTGRFTFDIFPIGG